MALLTIPALHVLAHTCILQKCLQCEEGLLFVCFFACLYLVVGERNGYPLWYSCLENLMNRGAWQAVVHGVIRVRHDLATKPPSPFLAGACKLLVAACELSVVVCAVQGPGIETNVPTLGPQSLRHWTTREIYE